MAIETFRAMVEVRSWQVGAYRCKVTVRRLRPGAAAEVECSWTPAEPLQPIPSRVAAVRRWAELCARRDRYGAWHRSGGARAVIAAMISGRLLADPERRATKTGTAFVTAKVVAATGDVDAVVSVAAFGSVAEELAAHSKGDSIAVSGRAQLSAWTGRDGSPRAGLNLTADVMLSAYALRRKRAAVAEAGSGAQRPAEPTREEFEGGDDDAWLAGGEVGR